VADGVPTGRMAGLARSTIQVRLPFSAFVLSASFPPDDFKHRINLSQGQPSCFVIVRAQSSVECRSSRHCQVCSVVDTLLVAAAEANKPSGFLLIPLGPLWIHVDPLSSGSSMEDAALSGSSD
jgi:hypothetical protein